MPRQSLVITSRSYGRRSPPPLKRGSGDFRAAIFFGKGSRISTPAPLTAAVANAQHSTGPRPPEGKPASSRNAVKFGIYSHADILPGEDPAELAALVSEIEERFRPCTNVENTLCHEAIHGMWLYHRFLRIEHEIVQIRVAALAPEQSKYALGHVYAQDLAADKVLEKIDRRRRAALRPSQDRKNVV